MDSFSIWHLIFLLIIVCVIAAVGKATSSARDQSNLVGIDGWLAVLLVMQTLSLLATAFSAYKSFKSYDGLWDDPDVSFVFFSELAFLGMVLAIEVCVLWAGITKKRLFVNLYCCQWLVVPVLLILDAVIASALLEVAVAELLTAKFVATMITRFIIDALWVWYTRASVRVKNTMVN